MIPSPLVAGSRSYSERFPKDARGRAAAPASSLDICTLNDRLPSFACVHRDFGGGRQEVVGVWMEAGSVRRRTASQQTQLKNPLRPRGDVSLRRSKSEMRRRCFVLAPTAILTLTKRGKFESEADLWDTFGRFRRLMKKFYGDAWRYVAVPELHSDGRTWHIHCAVAGFYWAGIVRRLWHKALGVQNGGKGQDSPGNIDFASFRRGKAVSVIARYLGKYLSKGAALRQGNRRCFAASVGLSPVVVSRWREPLSLGLPEVSRIIGRVFHGRTDLRISWWDYGGAHGFTISTPF